MPFTKESLLYREIFEKYYPGQAEMIVRFLDAEQVLGGLRRKRSFSPRTFKLWRVRQIIIVHLTEIMIIIKTEIPSSVRRSPLQEIGTTQFSGG